MERLKLSTELPPRPVEEGDIVALVTPRGTIHLKVTGVSAVGEVSMVNVERIARRMKLDENGRLKDA